MSDVVYECVASLFQTPQQRYLMSHYLWGPSERTETLINYLRIYDLLCRMYYVMFQSFPPDEFVVNVLKDDTTREHYIRMIRSGVFPIEGVMNLKQKRIKANPE